MRKVVDSGSKTAAFPKKSTKPFPLHLHTIALMTVQSLLRFFVIGLWKARPSCTFFDESRPTVDKSIKNPRFPNPTTSLQTQLERLNEPILVLQGPNYFSAAFGFPAALEWTATVLATLIRNIFPIL